MPEIEFRKKPKDPKADLNLANTTEGEAVVKLATKLGIPSLVDLAKK